MVKNNKKNKNKNKNKNKSKSNSNSITEQNQKGEEEITIESLIRHGDTAMDTSDCTLALNYYNAASESLRQTIETTPSNQQCVLALASLLSKSGEANVSLGHIENGKECFQEAITLLNNTNWDVSNIDTDADADTATDTDTDNVRTDNDASMESIYEVRSSVLFYLGQLCTGEDALNEYQKGIHDLEHWLKSLETRLEHLKEEDMLHESKLQLTLTLTDVRKQICSAQCTIAELYLTDLCFDPNAESQCEKALKVALEYDTLIVQTYQSYQTYLTNQNQSLMMMDNQNQNQSQNQWIHDTFLHHTPDALQAMANLRLSQSNPNDATQFMLKAYERMKKGCTSMSKLVGLYNDNGNDNGDNHNDHNENALELEHVDEATSLPNYEFRCQSSKLLLECGALNPDYSLLCNEAAIQVLGSLLAENDEVIEIWYLLGCAFHSLKNYDMAKQYWERALEMLQKVKKGYDEQEMMDDDDDDDDDDIEEQMEEIEAQIDDIQDKLQQMQSMESMDMEDV